MLESPVEIFLNLPQSRAYNSEKKKILFVAGLGVGKSVLFGFWQQKQVRRVEGESFGLVLASTKEQLRDSTMPQLQQAWDWMGLYEDEHYVIGRRPPRHWGIQPWHPSNNSNIITWYWGAYTKCGSTEKFNTHRGPEFDYILGDEWRDWKDGAVEVLVPRLRGKAFKEAGLVSQILLGTSPPDDPDKVERFMDADDVEVIEGTTYDNELNLPDDYIDTLEGTLDELTFRRDVLGERIHTGGQAVARSFSTQEYPAGNRLDRPFDPEAETVLTCDFNASEKRPMSWMLGQRLKVGDAHLDCIVTEFVNAGTDTQTQADIVFDWLIERGFRGHLHGRGDATGGDKARNSATSLSDHRVIEARFRSGGLWRWHGMKTRRTRRVKDRVASTNARFRTYPEGVIHMVVNKQTCPKLWAALLKLRYQENGYDLQDNEHKDPFDALSYWPHFDHPAHHAQTTVTSRGR